MTKRPNGTSVRRVASLTEALDFLRLSETSVYRAEFRAPWSFVAPNECPKTHFIASGRCWLEVAGYESRWLEPGDFVVIPRGRGHRIASMPEARNLDIVDFVVSDSGRRFACLRKDGSGAATVILCTDVDFKHPAADHLVALLPGVLSIPASDGDAGDWLAPIVSLLVKESLQMQPGAEAVIARLTDVLVIQAIRLWLEGNPLGQAAWLAAVEDPNVSRALSLIHRRPETGWTVGSLAKASAMSRSAFAARFTDLLGEPPMRYLTRWRMHCARSLLQRGRRSIEDVAGALGYQSAAAFSRAFKRSENIWPGAVLKKEQANPEGLAHNYLRPSRRASAR